MAVSSADKSTSNVIVVTDFGTFRFTLYKLVTANVAPSCIIIFFLLAGTKTFHCSICPENCHDLRLPHDERVKEFGERVLFDFDYDTLVKVIKTRGEDSRSCAYFVLLSVGGLLYLATGWLKDGLKVRVDDKWRLNTMLVLVKFDLRLF